MHIWDAGLDGGCVYGGHLTACVVPPAGSKTLLSKVKELLGHCTARGKHPGGFLTLQQLGAKIVSVPSRQPKKQ